jgi:hypothetical protein
MGGLSLGFVGCRSAYYSAMETVGVYKRDLLKKKVVAARDEQKEAGEQFQDALTRLKALYGYDGGNLEKAYRSLQSDFEKSEASAKNVHSRIRDVEQVAGDLFAEWEKELEQIQSPNLRQKSKDQLKQTRQKYQDLHAALTQAEKTMEPVVSQFRDHVLFLKHNHNAQAIASLKGEAVSIQNDIGKLIEDMNKAINRADEFIKTLPE